MHVLAFAPALSTPSVVVYTHGLSVLTRAASLSLSLSLSLCDVT